MCLVTQLILDFGEGIEYLWSRDLMLVVFADVFVGDVSVFVDDED